MSLLSSPAVEPSSLSEATASVESTIREALSVIRPDAARIRGDADLAQEADLDSAEVMDLVMEIEDRLDLSIPVETMAQARTIDELCAGIVQLKHGAV
ncbi:MAG: acyl carrier protein [Burkholderiaceae bacterium]|nr:acyl carrier protein [Burkholderiaceae bacterium]